MHCSYRAPDDGNISTLVDTLSNDFLGYLDMNRVVFPFLFQNSSLRNTWFCGHFAISHLQTDLVQCLLFN